MEEKSHEIAKFSAKIGSHVTYNGLGCYVLQVEDRVVKEFEQNTTERRILLLAIIKLLRIMQGKSMYVTVHIDDLQLVRDVRNINYIYYDEDAVLILEIKYLLKKSKIELLHTPGIIDQCQLNDIAKNFTDKYCPPKIEESTIVEPKILEHLFLEISSETKTLVNIYTDGSTQPTNPGAGGWAAIIEVNGKKEEISGGCRYSSNNRMEFTPLLEALRRIPRVNCEIHLYSDSEYVVDAINYRIKGWKSKGTLYTRPNSDLFERYLTYVENNSVSAHWIKGHNGHQENERCDQLARLAVLHKTQEIDHSYEESDRINYLGYRLPKYEKLYPFLYL